MDLAPRRIWTDINHMRKLDHHLHAAVFHYLKFSDLLSATTSNSEVRKVLGIVKQVQCVTARALMCEFTRRLTSCVRLHALLEDPSYLDLLATPVQSLRHLKHLECSLRHKQEWQGGLADWTEGCALLADTQALRHGNLDYFRIDNMNSGSVRINLSPRRYSAFAYKLLLGQLAPDVALRSSLLEEFGPQHIRDCVERGATAVLCEEAMHCGAEIIAVLLDAGASPNQCVRRVTGSPAITPLEVALSGRMETTKAIQSVQLLLDRGAVVPPRLLHAAVATSSDWKALNKIIKILLSKFPRLASEVWFQRRRSRAETPLATLLRHHRAFGEDPFMRAAVRRLSAQEATNRYEDAAGATSQR